MVSCFFFRNESGMKKVIYLLLLNSNLMVWFLRRKKDTALRNLDFVSVGSFLSFFFNSTRFLGSTICSQSIISHISIFIRIVCVCIKLRILNSFFFYLTVHFEMMIMETAFLIIIFLMMLFRSGFIFIFIFKNCILLVNSLVVVFSVSKRARVERARVPLSLYISNSTR